MSAGGQITAPVSQCPFGECDGSGSHDVAREIFGFTYRHAEPCRCDHESAARTGEEIPEEARDTIETPAPVDDDHCPRCHEVDCTPECIAAEEAESNAYAGPEPRKYT